MFIHIIFYVYAALAVSSAIAVVTARNPVQSVLSLVLTFFSTAAIWLLLHAEFLAIILVLVYVGAVMTLFLFVVMMLNIDREAKQSGFVRYLPFSVALIILLMAFTMAVLVPKYFGLTAMPIPAPVAPDYSNTQALGLLLFSDYVYPFEIAGVILLTAMIAAITLAHRPPRRRKVQNVSAQIEVRPEDRMRLINMPKRNDTPGEQR